MQFDINVRCDRLALGDIAQNGYYEQSLFALCIFLRTALRARGLGHRRSACRKKAELKTCTSGALAVTLSRAFYALCIAAQRCWLNHYVL